MVLASVSSRCTRVRRWRAGARAASMSRSRVCMRDLGRTRGAFGFGERRLRGRKRLAKAPTDRADRCRSRQGRHRCWQARLPAAPRAARDRAAPSEADCGAPSDRRARRSVRQRIFPSWQALHRPRRRGSLTPVSRSALACASALSARLFGVEAVERRCGIGRERTLACKVGRKLFEPAVELADPFLGAGLLALERFARDEQALQCRGGLGFRLAQRRQAGGDLRLARRRLRPARRCARQRCGRPRPWCARRRRLRPVAADPAQVEQQRFGTANLSGNVAIAHRLPRLGLERRDLRGKLADDIFDPRQDCARRP